MAHEEGHEEKEENVFDPELSPDAPSVSGDDNLEPASVWFPDYDRRHAGTIAPTGLAAGQQDRNLF